MASKTSRARRKPKAKSTAGTQNGGNRMRQSTKKKPTGTSSEVEPAWDTQAVSRKRKANPAVEVPKTKSRKSASKKKAGKVSVPTKRDAKKKHGTTKVAAQKRKATQKGQFQDGEPRSKSLKNQAVAAASGVVSNAARSKVTVKASFQYNKKDMATHQDQSIVKRGKGKCPLFAKLPPELLTKFFIYLRSEDLLNASLVCRSWNEAAVEMLQDVTLDGTKMSGRWAALLVRTMKKVKTLRLVGWNGKIIDPILIGVGEALPDLEALLIERPGEAGAGYADGVTLLTTLLKCNKIRELHIRLLPKDANGHLLDCMPLEWNVSKFTFTTAAAINKTPDTQVARNWATLRDVTLGGPSDEEFQIVVAASCGQLRKLRLGSLEILSGESLFMALSKFQLLEELHIENGFGMSDYWLLNGVGTVTNLQQLTLRRWSFPPEALYEFLSRENVVGKLVTLDLSYTCADAYHVSLIADMCPLLTRLSIIGCRNVTLDSLLHLMNNTPIVRLDLYDCFSPRKMKFNIKKITEVWPTMIVINCSPIKH